ncbi:MAG: NAD-dependent deacylase [Candidatus Kryptonium sp.]
MFSEKLIQKLKNAKSVVVLTGAGISAESGVPTFRGQEGLWKKFKPEELATFDAFIRNPELVWEWYNYRRKLILEVKPNPGHYALVELENILPNFTLITQNVDNLHRRAGSKNVIELHGNIERNYCIKCGKRYDDVNLAIEMKSPKCDCGGLIRPDVVWFGEMLPIDAWDKAEESASNCDVFFSVGTSGVVYPAASLPQIAKRSGAYTVEINIERTDLSWFMDEVIIGKSGEVLPELVKILKEKID